MVIETNVEVRCAVQGADILGEVPLWCERTRKLWWIDVRRPALQSYAPESKTHQAWRLAPEMVTGSIALRKDGGVLLAATTGIHLWDPAHAEAPRRIADPVAGVEGMRLNDGKCDRRGRFWVGSMHDVKRDPLGTLYRIDPDGTCTAMLEGLALPNAICWSLDDKTMYFADTHHGVIWAFDYDLDDSAISNRRVFKDWSAEGGRPDGATVDAEGYVWNCMVVTGRLVRLAPDGRVDRVIQLPVSHPTCPAFGGDNLSTLFITSHSQRLSPAQLVREPWAGALMTLDVGVKGVPEPRFAA